MARSLIDRIVYKLSQKPEYYKEVRNPPVTAIEKLLRPQDARQGQYNSWSRAHHVYSGSYLPKDGKILENQGWVNETSNIITNNKNTNPSRFYRKKKTNQWVRNEKKHWHWYNWWKKEKLPKNFMRGSENAPVYLDKYGCPCVRNSKESHIQGE